MYGPIKGPVSSSIHSQLISYSSSLSLSFAKFIMGLDGGRSIGMPKSSSERSSKLEFSDSEFVFGGVKFNGSIDMGDGGRERDGDLGADSDLGDGEGDLGCGGEGDLGGGGEGDLGEMGMWVVERGIWGKMGMWVVETVMWKVV